METITKTAGLSPARRRLVELMQKVRFGRIEKLQVRDGEPILDPPPPARRLVVFGKKNTPRASREGADFDLKKQVKELFDLFDSEGTFLIEDLKLEDGLPVLMHVKKDSLAQ